MLRLPAVFSDHMVLQRNKNILVWGESDSLDVNVYLNDKKVSTKTKDGKFSLKVPPMEAGGPYEMIVENGNDKIVYKDIMLGEVWLAGGQSNMELELQNSYDGKNILEHIDEKNVRFYYTPKITFLGNELEDAEKASCWELAVPESAGHWSAVGFYFAQKLSKELGVTVGVIGCNWGGTSASCWVSRKTLENDKEISSYIEEYDEATKNLVMEDYIKAVEDYKVYQAGFDKRCGEYYAHTEHPSWDECIKLCGENQYPGPIGPHSEVRPAGLYESMLSRVAGYTLAGFMYYQGEEDDKKPASYYRLLSALVRQWRGDWNDEGLPFMVVQLPMFMNECDEDIKNWAIIREAQFRMFKTFKNTGIAISADRGELNNIHPVHKQPVGYRLALQALCNFYNKLEEKEAFGPMYKTYETADNKIIITFDYAEDGFVVVNDNKHLNKYVHEFVNSMPNVYPDAASAEKDMLESFKKYSSYITDEDSINKCFEVAGEDKKYYYADNIEFENNKIIISSNDVKYPVYARYNWTNFGKVMVYGKNGLPVASFRTNMQDC